MRDSDDYFDEMWGRRLTDAEVERLLLGQAPDDDSLSPLSSFIDALAAEAVDVEEGTLRHHAAIASRIAAETASSPAPTAPRLVPTSRRRVAALLAATLLVGGASVATASDHAVPGDWNYGLDRAVERVGLNDGGSAERLAEVIALVEAGEIGLGLSHSAEILSGHDPEASQALAEAAARVVENGSEQSEETRLKVAELLAYLSTHIGSGQLGSEVSEMARGIGGPDGSGAPSNDQPPSSEDGEGPPDGVGPPGSLPPVP